MSDRPDLPFAEGDPLRPDEALSAPDFVMPAVPWALAYEAGSLFSTGSIGDEIPWVFGSEDAAKQAIALAEIEAPGFGDLTPIEVAWEHLLDRYGQVLMVDGDTRWVVALSESAGNEDTPLPDEPYALFVWGGGIDRFGDHHEEGEWVVHRDERGDFVLFFEDLDSAEAVLREFREATGDDAEVRRTRAVSLTDSQSVRFTHRDGHREDLSRDEYLRRSR